jgi:tetratricopeptide (TPR) repeat protein
LSPQYLTRLLLSGCAAGLAVCLMPVLLTVYDQDSPQSREQVWVAALLATATARDLAPDSKDVPYEPLVLRDSPEVTLLEKQLFALLKSRKTNEARILAKKFGQEHRCQEDYYQAVAEAFVYFNMYREANQYCSEGIRQHPRSRQLHYLLAQSWLQCGELEQAETELRTCLRLQPTSETFHAALADLYNHQEKHNEALKEIDRAIAANPKCCEHWIIKGSILCNSQRDQEALEALNKAFACSPPERTEKILNMRGPILQRLGRYEEAIQDYGQILKKHPADFVALNHTGECYASIKKPKEALPYFDRSIKDEPGNLAPHQGRLAALEALKETRAAEQEKALIHKLEEEYGAQIH